MGYNWFKEGTLQTKKLKYLWIVGLISLYIIINLLTLLKFPLVWRDDAMMSDAAWQFLKTGKFSTSMFEGFYTYEGFYRVERTIHFIFLAGAFKLLGCGPYQARLVSFLCGLLAALFIYLIGKRLFNSKIGMTGMILFLLSPQFLINSHIARQEMMLTWFIVMAIYIYLLAKDKNSRFLFFCCGLIAGLSLEVHLNGVMLLVVLGVLFLYNSQTGILKKINFFYFIGGVIPGLLYLIISHVLPDISIFWKQSNAYLSEYLRGMFNPPIFSGKNLFELLSWEAVRYKHVEIWEVAFIVIALIFGAKRKLQNKHILLIIIFVFMLLFTLLVAHKSTFYIIYLYPFFMLSVASFSYLSKNQLKMALGKAMILILAFLNIFLNGYILYEFKESNYYKYLDKLKKFIQPGVGVAGQPTWWYGFYDTHKYYALAAVDLSKLEKDISTAIKEKNIKYLLVDEYWRKDFPPLMEDFLNRECMLVASLKDKFYGGESFFPSSSYYSLDIYKVK